MTDDLLQRIRAARSKPSLLERIRASRSSDSRANEDVEGPFAIMRPSRPASAPNIGDALVAMQPEKVAEFAGEAGSLVEKSGFQFGRSALNTIPEAAASLVELPAKGAKAFLQAVEPGMRRLGIVPDALPSAAYQQAVEEYRPMGAEDAAEAIRGQKAPPIAGMEGGIADKVGTGVGYAAQAVLVPGSVGAKLAFGATEAAASGFVTNLEVAKAEGASPQEALGAALAGAGIQAAASTLPLHKALTGLEKASGGLVGKALTDAIVFGGAGAGQSALNDVVMEHATGKDREILKNAAEAGMLGILTGPIVTALSVAAMAGARTGKQAITDKGPEVDLSPKIDTSTFVRGDDTPPDAGLGMFKETPEEAALSRIAARMKKAEEPPVVESPRDTTPVVESAPPLAEAKAPEQTTEAPVGKPERVSGEAAPTVRGDGGAALPAKRGAKKPKGSPEYEVIRSETEPNSKPILVEKKTGLILPDTIRTPDVGPIQEGRAAARIGGNAENPYRRYIREQAAKNKHADDIYYEYARDWDSGFAGGKSLTPESTTKATSPEPPASKGKGAKVEEGKQPWEMTRNEFDRYWVAKSKEGVAGEVAKNTAKDRIELDRLRKMISDDPGNPAIGSIKDQAARIEARIAEEQKRLTAPIKKPSEFMDQAQYRWHQGVDAALKEGKPVPPEVLADYPDLAAKIKPNSEAKQIPAASEPVAETVAHGASKPAKTYQYKMLYRPPQFAAPKGWRFVEGSVNNENKFGVIEFDKPLSRSDIESFQLEPLDPADPINVKKRNDALRQEVINNLSDRDTLAYIDRHTGRISMLSPDPRKPGKFRITRFENDGTPSGHDEYSDLQEAIKYAAYDFGGVASESSFKPVAEPVVPKVEKPAVAEMPKGGAEAKTSTQSLSLTAKSPWESFLTAGSNFIGGGKTRPKEVLTDPEGRYVPRDETAIEASLRRIADRFHTLRRVEKEAPAPGQFSDAEVRMHGRAAYKHRQLEREQRSATNLMREAGVTAQDMADYATARHAEARNAIIRERTGGKTENGSGMNLARAKEILARATPAMKRIMEIHDRVRDRTREFMVESGLISRETADAWQRTFGDTYTPLKTIEDPGTEYIRGSGKSLQTRGPETKRAMGRSTEADNPFVQMFQDAQEAISRGEKNIVAQEFGKFAADNPSTAWEFVEPKNGHPPSGEDIFTYKVGGVEHYIRVSDEITLRALKNLDPVVSNRLFRAVMAGSRLMSGFATSRNPDFILPNFVRDLQTAAANISVEQGEKMAAKAVAGSLKAVHQIGKAVHSPEAAQGYAKEYLELGALTDWIEPQTIQKRLSGLDKMLKESTPRRGLREVAEVMNSIGSAVENGTRFAAYKEFRSAGIPAEKAVVLAKELTVNWSKKGEWGPFANSLYLFFSASANGTLRMGQVIRSNPAKAAKIAGAFVATGYAVAALNRAWGGKDEQDDKLWWDKQNDSNKRRYAMIQHQDGETTKMPLAPGWGFFYYLGTKLEEAAHTHKADIGNLVSALAEQTIPVGGGSPAQVVSPWFLDPVVQTSENKDFKGDPIYQERFPGDTAPYASHPDDRASETAKAISKLANELTGGTGVRRGSVDIPPRAIDHVTAEAGSGLGRFLDRVQRVARAKIKGEENPWREWPVISRFKGDKPDTYARDYRANMERLDVEEAAMKAGEKYDSAVVAQKRRAALFDKRVKALREAGMYEEAKRLMAAFNKDFPR